MRIVAAIYIVILSIFILQSPLTAETLTENSDFILAKKSFLDGFYEIAANSLEKFIKENPSDLSILDARLLLGESFVQIDKYNDAIMELDTVLRLTQDEDMKVEAAYWKAETYFRSKDFKTSKELYTSIITDHPESNYVEMSLYSIAWSLYEEGDYKGSLKEFESFLSKYPKSNRIGQVELKIGEILYRLKQYEASNSKLIELVSRLKDTGLLKKAHFFIAENYYYASLYKDAALYYKKALAFPPDPEIDIYAQYGNAWSLLKSGDHEASIIEFEKLKEVDKNNPISDSIVFGRAEALYKSKRFNDAVDAYKELIESFPKSKWLVNAYLGSGDSFYQTGSYNESLDVLSKAIAIFPIGKNSDDIRYNLGWVYFKLKKYNEAIEEFNRVIKESHSDFYRVSTYCRLGDLYAELDQSQKALDAYDMVLKESTVNPDAVFGYVDYAQYQIARLLFKLEKYQGAILAFQSLIKNYPDSKNIEDAKFGLAVAYFKEGDYESSARELNSFLSKFKDSTYKEKAIFQLASAYFNLFNYKEALKTYKMIAGSGMDPEYSKRALYETAWCYYKMGETKKTVAELQGFISNFPEDLLSQDARFWLGEYFADNKDYNTAERYFNEVVEKGIGSTLAGDADFRTAIIFYDKGEKEKSIKTLKRIIEEYPESDVLPKTKLKLSEILIEKDRLEDAKEILTVFMATYEDTSYVKMASKYLGDALKKEGQIEETIKYYKKAIDNTRGDFNAKLQQDIGKLYEELGELDTAISEYIKVGYIYPDSVNIVASSQLAGARLLEGQKKWKDAEKLYNKVASMEVDESKIALERLNWIKNNK
ncbi:MAG: tetratricopeptide repeat protein [Candidatus Omnitrophota bacterium]